LVYVHIRNILIDVCYITVESKNEVSKLKKFIDGQLYDDIELQVIFGPEQPLLVKHSLNSNKKDSL